VAAVQYRGQNSVMVYVHGVASGEQSTKKAAQKKHKTQRTEE